MWYIKRPENGVPNALYLMESVGPLGERAIRFDTKEEAELCMEIQGVTKECPEANAVFEKED